MARKRKYRGDLADLSKYARQIVILMRAGERLCKQYMPDKGLTYFYLEPSGRGVRCDSARHITASRYVVPMGDGLLGSVSSQTWAAR